MDAPPPAPVRRPLRTYAKREDAEQAQSVLSDHGIAALVEEHFCKQTDGKKVSGGCTLSVESRQGADAARVLLKMPPSETAGKPSQPQEPPARNPLRRRVGLRRQQRSSLPMIVIAVACSAIGLYWIIRQAILEKRALPPSPEENSENVYVSEDVNWDGETDSIREYSPGGQMLSILEDRDFDGKMDLRWIWQRGHLIYRDRDTDHDGAMDERTTFDTNNDPFYVDVRDKGKGPVVQRRVYREGVLWKILDDKDADTHFERIQEFTPDGVIFRDEALPENSPENGVPKLGAVREGQLAPSLLHHHATIHYQHLTGDVAGFRTG